MAPIDTQDTWVLRWLDSRGYLEKYPNLKLQEILDLRGLEPVLTSGGWVMYRGGKLENSSMKIEDV